MQRAEMKIFYHADNRALASPLGKLFTQGISRLAVAAQRDGSFVDE